MQYRNESAIDDRHVNDSAIDDRHVHDSAVDENDSASNDRHDSFYHQNSFAQNYSTVAFRKT